MLEAFKSRLAERRLIPEGTRVLVGFSGGRDSTCLVHLMKHAGIDMVVAHLHHGQRPEAEREMQLCEAFCKELDVPFLSGRADVPRIAAERKMGLEEAGREARYAFFEQAAHSMQCGLIATAHTSTDHVETVLLFLARGAGLSGLSGIARKRGNIIRPLLDFSRADTLEYCREHGLWFHDDPANEDISFTRARIRHRILPEFESINPGFGRAVMRLSELVREEDEFLDASATHLLSRAEIPLNGDLRFLTINLEAAFDSHVLRSSASLLVRRALRLLAEALGANLTFDQSQSIIERLMAGEKGSITTEGGEVVFEWDVSQLHARTVRVEEILPTRLPLPGEISSEVFGWRINLIQGAGKKPGPQRASLEAVIDRELLRGHLRVRSWSAGDQIQPLGFNGTRKVADLLSEAKLTEAARKRLPILCDDEGPIWVPNICLSQRVTSSEGGESWFTAQLLPINGLTGHNMETAADY
ncbi:MAG: tRNA lysidine(34) synthetase TilS [Armatimonadetes bacterium]|nr:tRNA lysidine(34) synthetase TilS [Armatimonadota bacterium]